MWHWPGHRRARYHDDPGLFPEVELRAMARRVEPGWMRVWVGIFNRAKSPTRLEWSVDSHSLGPEQVRTVRPIVHMPPGPPDVHVQSGLYDLQLLSPGQPAGAARQARPIYQISVTAYWGEDGDHATPASLRTRPLPGQVPLGLHETFRVLLVSCFDQRHDRAGQVGEVMRKICQAPTRPDLVLTVGDQVYLDNPVPASATLFGEGRLADVIETKYRKSWQSPQKATGYADVLRAAPVAAIPDDHEYWNNYPVVGAVWPGTWFRFNRDDWARAARRAYDTFQLGSATGAADDQAPACCTSGGGAGCVDAAGSAADPGGYGTFCYELDVAPLSFFMMDNRTFRALAPGRDEFDRERIARSMRPCDLARYQAWVQRVIDSPGTIPVLVTGPSLFQVEKFHQWRADFNFANVPEYPEIMRGLIRLCLAGCPPLALTGDVHYPRVSKAHLAQADFPGGVEFHEVISSPAALVTPWFQHKPKTKPENQPNYTVTGDGRRLAATMTWPEPDKRWFGNHVALLSFSRVATGVRLQIQYWPIHKYDEIERAPVTGDDFKLLRQPAYTPRGADVPPAPTRPPAAPTGTPSTPGAAGPTTGPAQQQARESAAEPITTTAPDGSETP